MNDKTNTPETDELNRPDFLDRSSPEVIRIVEAGRKLSLDARRAELAKATAPATVRCEPKPKRGSATAMAAKPKQTVTKPDNVITVPKAADKAIVGGKKSDAEMIEMIKQHRTAAGGTAGKTLKVLRGLGISCSQERFKGLYAKVS